VTQLINNTYETEEQSSDVTKIATALKKTPKATKCSDHRTISLIVHIAQIVARILRVRIEGKIEDILGVDLFGFKIRKGSTDAIWMTMMIMLQLLLLLLLMLMISERTYGQGIVCVLTEWQMALECVKWTKLMPIVKGTGIN